MKRELGIAAVVAVVAGNMLGSGIFFVPGELAALTGGGWPTVWLWPACGLVLLMAALSAAEAAGRVPESGAMVVVLHRAYGPKAGFLKAWADTWIVGPGVMASIALVFGELVGGMFGAPPMLFAVAAIVLLTLVNAAGVRVAGRVQTGLTALKLGLVAFLCTGGLLADAAPSSATLPFAMTPALLGASLAMVLFCFDGWLDVINVAGEVRDPERNIPRGLIAGVVIIAVIYVAMNASILRMVPLETIQADSGKVPQAFAEGVFGATGSLWITASMAICMLGALGGVLLTFPRVVWVGAQLYLPGRWKRGPLRTLGAEPSGSVPLPALLLSAGLSLVALTTLSTFSNLVAFMTATMAIFVALLVSATFALRRKEGVPEGFQVPGYPWLPALAAGCLLALAVLVTIQDPKHALLGLAWIGVGGVVAVWLRVGQQPHDPSSTSLMRDAK
jgi:APA family basic amino acid/polyamine antiporter